MSFFEYFTLKIKAGGGWSGKLKVRQLDSQLNMLGEEGWDLTASIPIQDESGKTKEIALIFKREVEEEDYSE